MVNIEYWMLNNDEYWSRLNFEYGVSKYYNTFNSLSYVYI
jgi:hypothetical protein